MHGMNVEVVEMNAPQSMPTCRMPCNSRSDTGAGSSTRRQIKGLMSSNRTLS